MYVVIWCNTLWYDVIHCDIVWYRIKNKANCNITVWHLRCKYLPHAMFLCEKLNVFSFKTNELRFRENEREGLRECEIERRLYIFICNQYFESMHFELYLSQKQLSCKMKSRLVIIECAGNIFWQFFLRQL